MAYSSTLISLLVVIAVSAQCAIAQIPTTCTAAQVTAGQTFCKDCKTSLKCTSTAAPVTLATCAAGTACSLVSIGGTSTMAACVTLSTTPCKCSAAKICDAYDPAMSWACISGALYPSTTCTTPQACSAGACMTTVATIPTTTPTTTPSPITGKCTTAFNYIYMNKNCTSAGYCTTPSGDPAVIINCNATEYFDTSSASCVTAPPQPCAGCVGACPDKTNCANFLICNSTAPVLIAQQQCPSATPSFDVTTSACGTDATKCAPETVCNFGVSTTPTTTNTTGTTISSNSTTNTTGTTPTSNSTVTATTSMPSSCTAANVGKSYPYPGDCKKYNGCRLIATNTYGYVVGTCSGSLVFNPTTSYCDLPANVPSCVTTG